MAAKDASESHPSAAQSAVAIDGLYGIFGTSRHEAAGWRKQGRDGPLVCPQELQRDEFCDVTHGRLSGSGLGVFRLLLSQLLSQGPFSRTAFVRLLRRLELLRLLPRRSPWSVTTSWD